MSRALAPAVDDLRRLPIAPESPVYLTRHAVARWRQRVARGREDAQLQMAVADSVRVPSRLAAPDLPPWWVDDVHYRASASALFVVRVRAGDRVVVTTTALDLEVLAAVLVHRLTGLWV